MGPSFKATTQKSEDKTKPPHLENFDPPNKATLLSNKKSLTLFREQNKYKKHRKAFHSIVSKLKHPTNRDRFEKDSLH